MRRATRGVIAAGHQKTAEAGQAMFALGGNAFDAAIAAVLAAFVVESTLTSAAGGGFLLAHTQDNRNLLFDFFCHTPRRKESAAAVDFYPVEIDFGGEIQCFHIGLGSIAVPGNLAGIFEVHKRLGRLPFEVVAEPAIQYAKNGFAVTPYNSFTFQLLTPILLGQAESRKIYAPQGRLLTAGQTCYMKDFADLLTELANRGAQTFYRGEIAHQLVQDLSQGGHLTLEDLAAYQVIVRQPLKMQYRGYELLTNPTPSSGGTLIAFALKLLESCDLQGVEFGSDRHLHSLSQVMYLTNQARKKSFDAHVHRDDIDRWFLAGDHLENYQNQISDSLNKWGSTTHISTLDSEGNAASITTSNGEGSSYVIPGTGIMLNNMLGEADLNPLGFHQWACDRRISSMMSPTLVLKEGKPEIVLGSGGSNRIRTAILQVISNLLDFNFSVEEAVHSPRVHWENNIFSVEPPFELAAVESLRFPTSTEIIFWQEKNMFFGGVHAVRKTDENCLEGAGDPRREGVALNAS
jgi:gamma-glutamyltranspeptidase/glutathione hydrolase